VPRVVSAEEKEFGRRRILFFCIIPVKSALTLSLSPPPPLSLSYPSLSIFLSLTHSLSLSLTHSLSLYPSDRPSHGAFGISCIYYIVIHISIYRVIR